MKTLIIITLSITAFNSYALRCGTEIIDAGDSINKVTKECNIDDEYQVNNVITDQKNITIKKDGMTYELKIIDGKVMNIEGSR